MCHFCFERFEVSLEIGSSFIGKNIEIYDCEICCNPNKLEYIVDLSLIHISEPTRRTPIAYAVVGLKKK